MGDVVAIIDKVLRAGEGRTLRKLKGLANQVNALEEDFVAMTDEQLRGLTAEYRERLEQGETLDDLLPEAFATVREAARRTLGQRHYDVQIMGGAALHLGNIAEMKTGEGKTLVSTLPAYLNALSGKGVHVVTVNDYLAERDSAWMGRVHRFLGLEVGCILASMSPAERRKAYAADITYGTNNEFGFDYLRDNMAWSRDEMVQRGHNYAIVDEVDSILVDEARTPLIISGPSDAEPKWFAEFARLADRMTVDEDYEVDIKKRTVGVLESGVEHAEDWLGIDNLYEAANTSLVGFLNNAIKAKELFLRDRDYVVMDGEVLIIDEHTGRILQGRRYNEGLHQAIEAKEGVEVKAENQTLATITLQNFFRLYDKLGGMTGTAMTEAAEFNQIYDLGVVPIPTNREMIRVDQADLIYRTEQAKFAAVVEDVAERFATGQPVLIGTVSVEKSELLSGMLRKRRIPHEVLNAKYHEREAAIVAEAGRKGAITVATNMAGRGTDIMLGGNPEFRAAAELERRGISSVDDPETYESEWPKALAEAEASVAAEHEEVVGLGGLYVLGTERHESRRIDNQLRGRSGRQGDPGETRFYLSLEDSLMRRFNAAMVDSFLTRFNVPDEQPIEAKMVSRAIQSAQSQVEAQNFEIRKNILKYDEVLNKQRQVVYEERRSVLEGEDLEDQLRTFVDDAVAAVVTSATSEGYPEDWDLDQLWTELRLLYPVGISQEQMIEAAGGQVGALSTEFLLDQLQEDAQLAYDRRTAEVGEQAMRELERRVVLSAVDRRWREHLYEMDYLQEGIGLRAMAQRDPLVEYQREGYDMFAAMMESIKADAVGHVFHVDVPADLLQTEDPAEMDAVIDAVIESGPGGVLGEGPQRPTQLEYSSPTLDAEDGVEHHTSGAAAQREAVTASARQDAGGSSSGGAAIAGAASSGAARRPASGGGAAPRSPEFQGVPRNAPCPCGSGKKFKRCHGDPRNAA